MFSSQKVKLFLVFLALGATLFGAGFWVGKNKGGSSSWEWVLAQERMHTLSSEEVNDALKELKRCFPKREDRFLALSLMRLGTLYEVGKLGEEEGEDPDPLFRWDVTDCTAFVLTNVALLNSESVEEAEKVMELVNYRLKEGKRDVSFEGRLHFTTDRLESSPYFKNITKEVGEVETETVVLNKKAEGERLLDIDWQKEKEVSYVPSEKIDRSFLEELPSVAGLAFVNRDFFEKGLDVVHEGLLFSGHNLLHASSYSGKVELVDFDDYYFSKDGSPNFDGIIVFDPLVQP